MFLNFPYLLNVITKNITKKYFGVRLHTNPVIPDLRACPENILFLLPGFWYNQLSNHRGRTI